MPRDYHVLSKLAELAAQIDTPRPFLEKIRAAERERDELLEQIAGAETGQQRRIGPSPCGC